jgi:hypothetical protein
VAQCVDFGGGKEATDLARFSRDPACCDAILLVDLDSILLDRYFVPYRNPHLYTAHPQRHVL